MKHPFYRSRLRRYRSIMVTDAVDAAWWSNYGFFSRAALHRTCYFCGRPASATSQLSASHSPSCLYESPPAYEACVRCKIDERPSAGGSASKCTSRQR